MSRGTGPARVADALRGIRTGAYHDDGWCAAQNSAPKSR